jgi:hypothetical protein
LEFAQKSRESPHKADITLLKQAAESFVPGMYKRYDIVASESMPSPFEKQLCYHKQVTQYIFGVKEGESKKSKSPSNNNKIHKYFECVYAYGKREPGRDHTLGAYTNIGASPYFVEYR